MDMPSESKPMLFLNSKDLPEIKDWKIGESYDLIVSVKQVGAHDNKGLISGDFEIQDIMSAPDQKSMDLEDINNLSSNADFSLAGAKYREKNAQ